MELRLDELRVVENVALLSCCIYLDIHVINLAVMTKL